MSTRWLGIVSAATRITWAMSVSCVTPRNCGGWRSHSPSGGCSLDLVEQLLQHLADAVGLLVQRDPHVDHGPAPAARAVVRDLDQRRWARSTATRRTGGPRSCAGSASRPFPTRWPCRVVRSTTSPTSNCPSRKMNSPLIVSRTSVCAPNPSAIPAMPAEAMSGVMSTPSVLQQREQRTRTTRCTTTTPANRPTTVATRRRRRPSASSPPALARRRKRRTQRRETSVKTTASTRVTPSSHPCSVEPVARERLRQRPAPDRSRPGP